MTGKSTPMEAGQEMAETGGHVHKRWGRSNWRISILKIMG